MSTALLRDRVRRLRVPGKVEAHRQLRAALAASDLHPPSLPRSAIVLLRQVRVPLPRRAVPAWQQQVRDRVDQIARRAAWPARESVGAACDAVVFADEAELLACLANDSVVGRLREHWWWPLWLGTRPANSSGAAQAFIDLPQAAPEALWRIASQGLAPAFLGSFPIWALQPLSAVIATTFALPVQDVGGLIDAVIRTYLDSREKSVSHQNEANTIWRRPSENLPQLDALQQHATATMLASPRDRARWALACLASQSARAQAVTPSPIEVPLPIEPRAAPSAHAPSTLAAREADVVQVAAAIEWPSASESRASNQFSTKPQLPQSMETMQRTSANSAEKTLDQSETAAWRPAAQPGVGDQIGAASPPMAHGQAASADAASLQATEPTFQALPDEEAPQLAHAAEPRHAFTALASQHRSVATQFGGLFYLVGVLQALGLYGDFTAPRQAGIALSPWALLALIARRWFAAPSLRVDPVWALLLELAGCESERDLDAGFTPPAWQIPPDWLTAFPDLPSDLFLRRRGRRMQSGRSFCVSDAIAPGAAADTESQSRRRWLTHLSRYLRARLARALGDSTPVQAPSRVCRRAARVVLTPTALDVHLSLAELPLAIRYAGLDRDPGWIPAAGRSLSFHYQ